MLLRGGLRVRITADGKGRYMYIAAQIPVFHQFQAKYKQSKSEVRADMKKVNEDDLAEQDLIVIPGQGRLKRTGFVKHDLDQGEHEGHTLKNSLHTIARAASELDKRLSVQSEFPEWVSEKIGAAKGMMVTVMDYMISQHEMGVEPTVAENASGGGTSSGGIASSMGGGDGFGKSIFMSRKGPVKTKKKK